MALTGRRVTVATTATRLDVADTNNTNRRSLRVLNTAATAAVILGGSDVTATSGYSLAAGANITIDLAHDETLYGIVAAATETVHILESGA